MAMPVPSQGKEGMIGPTGAIKKEEFVRVITQSLYSLGYERSGAILEEESGIPLHSSLVMLLKKQLLDGNWDDSVATLYDFGILKDHTLKFTSFEIYEHKFFELLGKNRVFDALETLRTQISTIGIDPQHVHELASCIVSSSQCALLGKNVINAANSRQKLVKEVQRLLRHTVMIPDGRLEHLVEQALRVKREACVFHNSLDPLSLYDDYCCGMSEIPSRTIQVLHAHLNQVWVVKFSDDGKYLASSSSDKSAIVWEVQEDGRWSVKHVLVGHQKTVRVVAWRADSQQLLTCGQGEVVRRWDVTSGECLSVYEKSGIGLTSCGWDEDGGRVFSTATDRSICCWDLDGEPAVDWCWSEESRASDMVVTKDGKQFIAIGEYGISVYYREAGFQTNIGEERAISSFSLSRDEKYLLVNVEDQIHLWSITEYPRLVMTYTGHKRTSYVVHSCIGGAEQAFVASGSEDSLVYMWLRDTGALVTSLAGHAGVVTCVSWHPTNPRILASASSDQTIRIWGAEDYRW